MSLLDDIDTEIKAADGDQVCTMCEAIKALPDDSEAEALSKAAAGSISERALHRVTTKNSMGVGRKAIARHRKEGHQP